jgi:subtilisin family serine protease
MTYLETAHETIKKPTTAREELGSSHELRGHPSPDGMSLSIQYVRQGLTSTPEVLLAEILQSWRHHTAPATHGLDKLKSSSHIPSRWLDTERNVESRWTRIMETASVSHSSGTTSCTLPQSTLFEHDDSVSRLNDLSEWQFASSTPLEATQHSTYCFMHLVEAIASHPSVLSMTVQGRPVLLNYDARGMIQSGNPVSTPFSDLGLYGEGQIVGVTDSGLDDYSCYFYDNSGVYSSGATTRSAYTQPKVEQSRRKVVQYVAYADGSDPAAGHGTHVVGTIVGDSIFDGYAKANGIAPAAKVAFYDVMRSDSPYLSIPDTYSYVYTTLYNAGARVLSNSWGSYASESEFLIALTCLSS